MQYDPVKRSLGNVFNRSPFLRKVFYGLLDLLLLRAWHVHKELRKWKEFVMVSDLRAQTSQLVAGGSLIEHFIPGWHGLVSSHEKSSR